MKTLSHPLSGPVCSIRQEKELVYPCAENGYGPEECYPEIPWSRANHPNSIYRNVRLLLADSCLDREHFGRKEWNPLQPWIKPGQKVFILCNFVQHRRLGQSDQDLHAKCTHASVIRAVCDYVLVALKGCGQVTIGNAPLQNTDWKRVIEQTGTRALIDYYHSNNMPVRLMDLRMLIREHSFWGKNHPATFYDDSKECVLVDLSASSLLTGVNGNGEFRVADYDPTVIGNFQSQARHRYLIHKEVLSSDVVISIPKLKTHEKVGITCGLKGFVGIVGRKECLAHHRFGNPKHGGDEYPSRNPLRLLQSHFHEYAHESGGSRLLQRAAIVVDRNLSRVLRRMGAIYGGAWHGNETCWRMALDVARIAHYCDSQGHLCDQAQRYHLCFIDGGIAGEGEGPLSPNPVPAGTLLFSSCVPLGDLAASKLMGFAPERIPLVREAFRHLAQHHEHLDAALDCHVFYNSQLLSLSQLPPVLGRPFRTSRGWRALLDPNS